MLVFQFPGSLNAILVGQCLLSTCLVSFSNSCLLFLGHPVWMRLLWMGFLRWCPLLRCKMVAIMERAEVCVQGVSRLFYYRFGGVNNQVWTFNWISCRERRCLSKGRPTYDSLHGSTHSAPWTPSLGDCHRCSLHGPEASLMRLVSRRDQEFLRSIGSIAYEPGPSSSGRGGLGPSCDKPVAHEAQQLKLVLFFHKEHGRTHS